MCTNLNCVPINLLIIIKYLVLGRYIWSIGANKIFLITSIIFKHVYGRGDSTSPDIF